MGITKDLLVQQHEQTQATAHWTRQGRAGKLDVQSSQVSSGRSQTLDGPRAPGGWQSWPPLRMMPFRSRCQIMTRAWWGDGAAQGAESVQKDGLPDDQWPCCGGESGERTEGGSRSGERKGLGEEGISATQLPYGLFPCIISK